MYVAGLFSKRKENIIMGKAIPNKRTDNRGRILKTGESQRKDGRYAYKYVGTDKKPHFVYSWRLNETDPFPKGKRPCKSLRELEKEIDRDIEDGINHADAKMTVCELYRKHIESNPNVRESTKNGREQLMTILKNDKIGNMSINKVKEYDARAWAARMEEKGYAFQTIKNHRRFLKSISTQP